MNSKGSNDPPLEKKRRLSVRDLPQFCDTAGTVSVASFGARRLPELRHLWEKTFRRASTPDPSNVESLKSTGCKTSRRHLRRRATSHLGRKHHRFPAGQQDANAQDKKSEHSIIEEPKLTRRKRRRNTEHLHSSHEEWKVPKGALGIPSTEDKESNGNNHRPDNWMPTHLWHVKRFHMESMWGWKVPMLHSNRGAKAALRLAREGKTILHDATWTSQPVWLRIATEVVPDMIDQIRIIIPDFALDETKLLEAFAYQPSAFPKGGIGPVAWLCSTSPLFGSAKDDTQSCYIYFFLHPSIQQTLLHILRQILEPSTLTGPLCFVHGGLSWLRLRGKAALESLQTAMLSIAKDEKRSTDIGAIIADLETGIDCQLSHVQCRAATNHETPNSQEVKLILRRPVQVDFHGNFGSCGVDVVCEPSLGQKLLVALVLHGMACPIGVTELAHLELECEPPRPLFPRDYPDTSVGMSYWKAALPEWKILRAYYEGGLGRIRPDRTSQQVLISWNTILPTDFQLLASEDETTVVTVRGSFGQPFQQAINGIGYIHRNGDKASNSGAAAESLVIRRSRRKSGNPSLPVQAPPISRDQVSQHRNLCKTLLLSLSLPAVLLAHICLHEKGQLDTGTLLYATDGSVNEPLGVVTAAIFSSGRGRYHGIAVVGAARLLEALQHAHDSCAGRIVAPRVGPKRIELEIGVARSNTYNEKHSTAKLTMFGTLSLLL